MGNQPQLTFSGVEGTKWSASMGCVVEVVWLAVAALLAESSAGAVQAAVRARDARRQVLGMCEG